MDTKWNFPEDPGWDGLNSTGDEHFTKYKLSSFVREMVQNSLDAPKPPDNAGPVTLHFDLIRHRPQDIPDLSDIIKKLCETIEHYSSKQNKEQEKEFLATAKSEFEKRSIQILKVSERNTGGMPGPFSDEDSRFFAYVEGTGLSCGDDTRRGSFGIGKAAPFALSNTKCVFVSTNWINDWQEKQFHCQGIIKSLTHKSGNKRIRGHGKWGEDGGNAISDIDAIPQWLRRDEVGTDFFIVNPDLPQDWEERIVIETLSSFFSAINDKQLVVKTINYEVQRTSARRLFDEDKVRTALDGMADDDRRDKFEYARLCTQCLSTSDFEPLYVQTTDVGNIKLSYDSREGIGQRVAFVRDGLLIGYNLLPKLKVWGPAFKEFIAIATFENEDGKKTMRQLEPPEHNDFFPGRHPEGELKGSQILKRIGEKIRTKLKSRLEAEKTELHRPSWIADLFGAEEKTSNRTMSSAVEIDPNGSFTLDEVKKGLRPFTLTTKQLKKLFDETVNEDDYEEVETEEDLEQDEFVDVSEIIRNPRITMPTPSDLIVNLSCPIPGRYRLGLSISGADSSEEQLAIKNTSQGKLEDGKVILRFNDPNERRTIKVKTDQVSNTSIRVHLYQEKSEVRQS